MKKIILILILLLLLPACSFNFVKKPNTYLQTQTKEIMLGADSGALSPGTMADDATVGTVAWTNPDNAKVSDNVYATITTIYPNTSDYLKATNFGFTVPAGSTINGILVEIERKASSLGGGTGYALDDSIKIVKSDGTFGTTNKADTVNNWPTTDTYKSYGSSSDLWGETWDSTKINDVDFGIVLSIFLIGDTGEGNSSTASVDHIRITVYYTAGAPPVTDTCAYSGTGDWNVLQGDNCYLTSSVYVNGSFNLIGSSTGMFGCAPGITVSAKGYNFGTQGGNTRMDAKCIKSHN